MDRLAVSRAALARGRVARACALVILSATELRSQPAAAVPFPVGEQLTYVVTWAHLKAGDAVLTVLDRESFSGRDAYHVVSQARSAGFFAWLFRFNVRDRVDAFLDATNQCSLGITKRIREGDRRRDQRVVFDRERRLALTDDPGITEKEAPIDACTLDVLTSMYWERYQTLVPGKVLEAAIHNNGKSYRVRVDVVKRERIRTQAGEFQTVLLSPQLNAAVGLFREGRQLQIWVTDDEWHVPVRLRSKFVIGWVTAALVKRETIRRADFKDITISGAGAAGDRGRR